jgi:hypothetical protein
MKNCIIPAMGKPATSKSPFSELYQLHLDVERIARALRERQKKHWLPLKEHWVQLYEISTKLKVLDKNRHHRF